MRRWIRWRTDGREEGARLSSECVRTVGPQPNWQQLRRRPFERSERSARGVDFDICRVAEIEHARIADICSYKYGWLVYTRAAPAVAAAAMAPAISNWFMTRAGC